MSDLPKPARIILITTDHLRADCIGAWGNPAVQTPHLDRLAEAGVNLRNCFSQNPVCMPSRASLFTGLYPQQTGVTNNGHCLAADFAQTLPRLLGGCGYRPVHVGKLHLQPHEDHDLCQEPDRTYGFDVFMRSEARGSYRDAWMTWLESKYPEHVDKFRVARPTDPARGAQEVGGWVVDAPAQASHCGWVVDAACRWLACPFGNRLNEPTFLHLGMHHPHPPLNPTAEAFAPYDGVEIPPPTAWPEEWADKPAPLGAMLQSRQHWSPADFLEYRRYFWALCTEADLAVGRLVETLAENNALDDTLLIVTSDHGDMLGDHGMTHKGPHVYDAVMHVPLLLHWPDALGAERRDLDDLVELSDLLPTILQAAGRRVPPAAVGRSLLDVLTGRADHHGRQDVLAFAEAGAMLRTDRYKYIRYTDCGGQVLFDLADDEPERRNLAATDAAGPILQEMRDRMLIRLLAAGRSGLGRRFRF